MFLELILCRQPAMSLLTSDDSRKSSQLLLTAIRFSTWLSILSYIAGLAYFGYLVYEPDKTYFSDNGLLPGLASREFTYGKLAEQYLSELENITSDQPEGAIPSGYLRSKFTEFGLYFYDHPFQLNYPFGQRTKHQGGNVYAILRAPRAASTEALVVSTPFRTLQSTHGSTLPSVALMLALAKFFSTKHYWAKDIIFVIADKELVGMQSWLAAYHGLEESEYLLHGKLPATAGVIQAALNLELHSFKPKSVDVKIEGLNGQLPNLDLFNVAIELCNREDLPATFHGRSFSMSGDPLKDWINSAQTLGSMMATQATTLPTGAHGLFGKFAIQSVTLEAGSVSAKKSQNSRTSAVNLGRAIEGILRSLNNLQQRFYRSFYFYLLPSTRRYISIGFYMIAFGLLCLPLCLRSLKLYFESQQGRSSRTAISLWSFFEAAFLAYLFGIITLSVPLLLARLDLPLFTQLPTTELLHSIFLSLSVVSLLPLFLRLRKSPPELAIQSMVALLNAALLFSGISLVNISLALALTALYVPLVFLVQSLHPSTTGLCATIRSLLQKTILLMIHPMMLHFFALIGLSLSMSEDLFGKTASSSLQTSTDLFAFVSKHLQRAFQSQKRTALYYIEDWYLYDNWSYPLVCLGLLPVWLQLWYSALCKRTGL